MRRKRRGKVAEVGEFTPSGCDTGTLNRRKNEERTVLTYPRKRKAEKEAGNTKSFKRQKYPFGGEGRGEGNDKELLI